MIVEKIDLLYLRQDVFSLWRILASRPCTQEFSSSNTGGTSWFSDHFALKKGLSATLVVRYSNKNATGGKKGRLLFRKSNNSN